MFEIKNYNLKIWHLIQKTVMDIYFTDYCLFFYEKMPVLYFVIQIYIPCLPDDSENISKTINT